MDCFARKTLVHFSIQLRIFTYKIGEIIRAAEENLDVVKCINNPDCPKKTTCKTYTLWEGLNNEINDYLDSKTLKDYL